MSRGAIETFECFGGRCSVRVADEDADASASAVRQARLALLDAHRTLSRFDPDSELSRLNRDPRPVVPASPLLRRVVAAALATGLRSGGLVDATLVDEIEAAGYDRQLTFGKALIGPETPPAAPAAPSPRADWRSLAVDERACTVSRPPGVRIDPGGIAKGLLADLIGQSLSDFDSYAVDCCGDIRIGGSGGRPRTVLVDDPAGGEPLLELRIAAGAVATSGTTRRAWTGPAGEPAHQILDPASGRPAFTGVVQITALAPSGLLAETFAKSALLAGAERAASLLPYGGVVVETGGEVQVADPIGAVLPSVADA